MKDGDSEAPGGAGKRKPGRRKPGDEPSEPSPAAEGAPAALSFEGAFALAEGAVDALERGNLSLEDSLKKYEEGLRALGRCYDVLRAAEKRIEVLASDLGRIVEGAEGPVWAPAGSFPPLRGALGAAERAGEASQPEASESGGAGRGDDEEPEDDGADNTQEDEGDEVGGADGDDLDSERRRPGERHGRQGPGHTDRGHG